MENEQQSRRVLVVDDEENIGDVVSIALRYKGFDVLTARSGGTAPQEVREWRPDALILDVMLPDMDGFEVARQPNSEHVDVPIVCLTARGALEHVWSYDFAGDARVLET